VGGGAGGVKNFIVKPQNSLLKSSVVSLLATGHEGHKKAEVFGLGLSYFVFAGVCKIGQASIRVQSVRGLAPTQCTLPRHH
jgi:hypothetical protein